MADDEKHQALLHNGEQLGVVNAAETAAMARTRSKALDLAVSQGLRQAQLHQQQVAQPQKPSIVRWERFLPQQQLRVLLVEDDDSTGHVVTALLRNCGYEVTFASSGLRAWELLMDQSCKVDLVLTEVVMPGLSGIGLLSRIMNLEPLKHIPVIMMSSLDSMGIVFKCLSKGAVDFLVKPVRKNELKNLWQHIWRRCQSSSGSGCGSGSGIGTQKVAQPTIAGEANNNLGSDDDLSDSLNSELNLEGGSDNGSGTESAWTKKAVEVKSPHQGVCEGSRMHSAIQSKEACLLEPDHQKGLSADTNLAKSGVAPAELPFFGKAQLNLNSAPEMVRPSAADAIDTGQVDMGTTDNAYSCVDCQVGNGINETLIKVQEGAGEQQADSEDDNDLLEKHASNSPSFKDKTFSDSSSPSLLKLSLKRPSEDENGTEGEARGAFKRSRSSAFSRYNSSGSNAPLPAETNSAKVNVPPNVFGDYSHVRCSSVGSNHPLSRLPSSRIDTSFSNIGSDEAMASPFSKGLPQSCSNQNGTLAHTSMSEKWNVGPCFHKEGVHLNTGSGMRTHVYPSPEMQRAFGSCNQPFSANINLPPQWGCSSEDVEAQELHLPHRFIQGHRSALANQDSEVHLHSHHHHHHVQHHYHCANEQPQQRPQTPPLEDSTVINVGESAPKCGSSNMETCPDDVNGQSGSCNGYGSNGNGAVSLNGSATGSNGGQSVAAIEPAGGIGNVDGNTQGLLVVHGHFLPLDESRHARREAALNKFRQKRKERCFEKKVRYQSRKRLAEQRPRVRGQFVKQSVK